MSQQELERNRNDHCDSLGPNGRCSKCGALYGNERICGLAGKRQQELDRLNAIAETDLRSLLQTVERLERAIDAAMKGAAR